MIKEVKEDELDLLDNSFININSLKEEFKSNPFAKLLLLEENDEIIGYIYYSDIYERVEINQFEINSIHRNCGKGNYLLKKFTKYVDKDITLEVKENNYSAIHLYKKNGFKQVAKRKGYYQNIDGILMERKKYRSRVIF